MEKVIELNLNDNSLKNYLEECLKEKNINYDIQIEDKWIQKFKNPSQFYQVYCLYVSKDDVKSVEEMINDYKNARIITDDVEELKEYKDDDKNNDKNYIKKETNKRICLKFCLGAIVLIGILVVIGLGIFH